jgi:hypothetical protein
MTALTFTEADRNLVFPLEEYETHQLDQGILASGVGAVKAGMVLGRIDRRQAAAPIPTIVGTGTGLMSALTFGPDVQVGAYVITLLATSATAAFSVVAPDGTALPNGAVGTAYKSNHLSFAIADGGTMTTGDKFTVTVTAGGTPVVVGGTGTGTCSAITLGPLAQFGTYKIINRAVVANGGDFEVLAPDGSSIGRFLMGTGSTASAAFTSDHINFTLTDATDFILGNYFNIIVAGYTAPEATPWDPTAVNGAQNAWGVLTHAADSTSAAQNIVAITRRAEVKRDSLQWKATVTAAQKIAAYNQLAAAGVIARA